MAFLDVVGVEKSYGSNQVVKTFSLSVESGEFVSFLGPSGCGKTTVLRMIAGFEEPSAGKIVIGGKDVTQLKPNQRNVGMVFQAYALFPNMTVAQNIGFGLKIAGMPKADADRRVAEMLDMIKLPQMADRYPYQLSGGQQQRIALARAIAPKPKLLLLDEPLSALDAKVRVSLREEIRSIQKKLDITTIFVTHDQEEALSISDRIAVMYGGIAEQVGTPFEIYNRPATKFVANFVGTLNVLEGTVTDATSGTVRVNTQELALKSKLNGSKSGDTLSLALRPEAISLAKQPGHDASLSGEIAEVHFLGSVIRVRVGIGGNMVSLDTFNNSTTPPPVVGQKADISFSSGDMLVLH
ncbi:ABC transporter ATP-binding protein [Mesorhizobium sp. B1-1-8]|uniref:ABC transporter ATP-binding protein n=1 Tax=Mesorhizobium sp. B1-1-8 TaxID=2589976 RepID=UPI001127BEF9|nr:ABC transporter ATP-binding protein [Mesorhizobium sp. B1-1-8]UCI09123.1 ABC transporter ATP-binding protein [Mesorhizobium sp. B1-1-8]